MEWFQRLFKPKPKIRVTYRNPNPSRGTQRTKSSSRGGSASSTRSTSSSRGGGSTSGKSDSKVSQEEINAILDKISDRGYESLSKEEKQKLFDASNQG